MLQESDLYFIESPVDRVLSLFYRISCGQGLIWISKNFMRTGCSSLQEFSEPICRSLLNLETCKESRDISSTSLKKMSLKNFDFFVTGEKRCLINFLLLKKMHMKDFTRQVNSIKQENFARQASTPMEDSIRRANSTR